MSKLTYDRDGLPPDLQSLLPARPTWSPIKKQQCQTNPKSYEVLKSCTQVAPCVEQQVVRHAAGELKLGEAKPFRLGVRLSENEHEIVVRHAEKAGLTLSEYVRVSILGPTYALSRDPVRRQHLKDLSRELGRQGNNLNQIAKHLNAGTATLVQGDSMLGMIARSLMSVHMKVAKALAEGQRYDE